MNSSNDTSALLADYMALLTGCIHYISRLLRKYAVSVLLLTLVCGAAGFGLWYTTQPYFESTMVCSYNNARLARKNYGEMVEKLDILARAKSYRALSALLQLPVEQTSQLIGFEAKNMAGSPLQEDITGNYQPLYFTVKAKDSRVYTALQPAMLHYLGDGVYQKEIGKIEIAKLERRITGMEHGILEADSIVHLYAGRLQAGGQADSAVFAGLTTLLSYRDMLDEKLVAAQQKKALEESPSVMVLHGFAPGDYPSRGSKKIIWAALAAGLFLGLIQALWREAVKKDA